MTLGWSESEIRVAPPVNLLQLDYNAHPRSRAPNARIRIIRISFSLCSCYQYESTIPAMGVQGLIQEKRGICYSCALFLHDMKYDQVLGIYVYL